MTIDWNAFESAVVEVCSKSLAYLDANATEDSIYGFGIEGGIEQGRVFVSANTVSARSSDTEWWLPDWKLTYIDERLGDDSCDELFAPFAEPFDEIVSGVSEEMDFDVLCRHFRLSCLKALRAISSAIKDYDFPRSPDFTLVYMDEAEAFYQGDDQIEAAIRELESTGR
ncbi:hypothetical protein [Sulfuriroseicoccus oceanibius]|uniref:DUF4303 domain-containing protein n=1 Tax=Sulfuriroseicoccus oceanibius TaxID=2707525 RepID=A0A7T7JC29_9BACT|nr:hypothetical protein [Sulfuriroseicoccus oceanibius]QQL44606.1 hypothetical protein G3M56_012045 [Sulfuriroseicoccus oceanibius]